jgi:hypothetical protein
VRVDTRNRTYHVSWGRVLLNFLRLRFRHNVTTPTIIAGVRGTELLVIADPQSGTDRILVYEGMVEVEGRRSGKAALGAGQQIESRGGVLAEVGHLSGSQWASAVASLETGASREAQKADLPSAPESATAAAPISEGNASGGCQGIQGIWRWWNGAMVECLPDGRCRASNGFGGPWKCLDQSGRFEIQWARPGQQTPYVDTVSLSSDGWELQGVNQSGQGVGGQRPEFAGGEPKGGCQALLGKWHWSGGAVVECRPDQTCTASSGLRGPWRCINDKGRFEIRWGRGGQPDQFIDTVVVSPLGSYLTGKNQYGAGVGATR